MPSEKAPERLKIPDPVGVYNLEIQTAGILHPAILSTGRPNMKRLTLPLSMLFLCLLALGGAHTQLSAQDASGHWDGAIITPQGDLAINVDLTKGEDGAWSGDISIPAQMAEDIPLADVVVEGNKVSFRMADVPGDPTFTGTMAEDGKTITGPFSQAGAELEFKLTRQDP